jgi:hypothetical protein
MDELINEKLDDSMIDVPIFIGDWKYLGYVTWFWLNTRILTLLYKKQISYRKSIF